MMSVAELTVCPQSMPGRSRRASSLLAAHLLRAMVAAMRRSRRSRVPARRSAPMADAGTRYISHRPADATAGIAVWRHRRVDVARITTDRQLCMSASAVACSATAAFNVTQIPRWREPRAAATALYAVVSDLSCGMVCGGTRGGPPARSASTRAEVMV